MKKYTVMPQVVVYKDLFSKEELQKFYSLLQMYDTDISGIEITNEEESMRKDDHGVLPLEEQKDSPLNNWVPWHTFGKKTFFNFTKKPEGLEDENLIFLYDFREKLYQVFGEVFKDYIDEWSDSGYWPEYIDNWNINNDKATRMFYSVIEILRHDNKPEKDFAIGFHTDTHEHRNGSPRTQQIITITMYVNDDYEGGDLQFLSEVDNKLITYKPKFGDLTVFPSGEPYFHSALAVKEGNHKVFVRVFALWDHPGSKEWFDNVEKYGAEEWNRINEEAIQIDVSAGKRDREVHIEGKKLMPTAPAIKVFIKAEDDSYVDGRTM
jgi:hypothetical protein